MYVLPLLFLVLAVVAVALGQRALVWLMVLTALILLLIPSGGTR